MLGDPTVEFGAHLPLMDFGGNPFTLDHLVDYTVLANELGFTTLAANDHLVFASPWLDGPTALASVIGHAGSMSLATTVALPVVRGPVALAKALSALDRLSGGRLIAGLGPGSSPQDYAAVGVDFGERWARFDEAVMTLRTLWTGDEPPFVGRYYVTDGVVLEPPPAGRGGIPIWLASWGSEAGLRRVARLGDGWIASAYNITPAGFDQAWRTLGAELERRGREAGTFPNAVGTMWFYITDDRREAERVLQDRVVPVVHRPEAVLWERLPIGSPERFAERLRAFAAAGTQRVFIWPIADELRQLERFAREVRPLLGS
jgi:alkanesulfonate monooxygenase SsuD/methylene tetrahydromethanopterin reductase-like flavin-dependent oxidoreductase (luciferase family)